MPVVIVNLGVNQTGNVVLLLLNTLLERLIFVPTGTHKPTYHIILMLLPHAHHAQNHKLLIALVHVQVHLPTIARQEVVGTQSKLNLRQPLLQQHNCMIQLVPRCIQSQKRWETRFVIAVIITNVH